MKRLEEILEQLSDNNITISEAKQQILVLFNVDYHNSDVLKIENLINNTYQVIDESENILYQGSLNNCNDYLTDYYG